MATSEVRRIGVLTGGGDCPGLNAVIRAVTKSAIFQHKLEVYGVEDGFLGLIRNRIRPLTPADVSNILTAGGTVLGTSNKSDPTHFAVDTDEAGQPIFKDVTNRVLEHIRARQLDALVCIGGDGTMTGASLLAQRGINCVGVPKTIDNDLMHTEITFGFQTAVQTATEALDRIHTTAASHHRVMIVETMGRNAGWLALHAGVASGSDVILIPEIPYDLKIIGDYCTQRSCCGKAFTIICVSEGARPIGGQQVVDQIVHDSPDPVRLGGIAAVLAKQIAQQTHLECRATILGHLQRGGTPGAFDRVLATQFGYAAMDLCVRRQWGRVLVQQRGQLTSVSLEEVADRQRLVPEDHHLIASARSVGTCFGDRPPLGE